MVSTFGWKFNRKKAPFLDSYKDINVTKFQSYLYVYPIEEVDV